MLCDTDTECIHLFKLKYYAFNHFITYICYTFLERYNIEVHEYMKILSFDYYDQLSPFLLASISLNFHTYCFLQ